MNAITDVIAAISTPPGKGGVAVIRICGEGAAKITDSLFRTVNGSPLSALPPRRQAYGFVYDDDGVLDDVMAVRFEAPHSYTGEETVEIYCHGGMLITRTVLERVLSCGARAAEAGEFTKRAFINGKLTLTDAELIGSLLEAKSREEISLASSTSRGRLNSKIEEIKTSLTELMSSIYARIDYPDEDLGDFDDSELLSRLEDVKVKLDTLISTYRTGRAISEGVSAVLCGKPNVGKSSIYNAILGEDAAIVTSVAGTTRDVLERSTALGRVAIRLKDTAGIRDYTEDEIEKIGINRSVSSLCSAELILAVFDTSKPLDYEDECLCEKVRPLSAAKIAILNKADVSGELAADAFPYSNYFDAVIIGSAKNESELIAALSDAVNRLMTDERINARDTAIVSSARQHAELLRTREFVSLAAEGLRAGFSQDAVSSDIERALRAISGSDAREVSQGVVSDIFSKFCVGK